jgi:hypothetical protein
MRRDRFQIILQCLHANNNAGALPRGNPNHDPAHKVHRIFDLINKVFKEKYAAARDLTVDESMVGHKGPLWVYGEYPWITKVQGKLTFLHGLHLPISLILNLVLSCYCFEFDVHTDSFQIMRRDRFQIILQCLHANNNAGALPRGNPNHDPAHKVRRIFDLINKVFKEKYATLLCIH